MENREGSCGAPVVRGRQEGEPSVYWEASLSEACGQVVRGKGRARRAEVEWLGPTREET